MTKRRKKASGEPYGAASLRTKITKRIGRAILDGRVLAVDPSCGSASSMPGYAIYDQGVLTESGILDISIGRDLGYRLQDIRKDLAEFTGVNVLVVEHIPARRYGGGGASGHASLLCAMGVAMASTDCDIVLTVRPQTWHSMKQDHWTKGDAEDAEAIGHCVITIAKEKWG